MRIKSIELRHVRMELIRPFETSLGIEASEEHIIVMAESEVASGWGESVAEATPYYSYETVGTAWHILEEFLVSLVIGKEFDSAAEAALTWGHIRGHRMAKAGLEAALWDVEAKEQGIPLGRLLGGSRDKIEVGVSIGIQESPEKLVEEVGGYLDQGYGRIKIKIAPGKDLKYIAAVRRKYPDIMLQVDANSAYRLKDIQLFREMDDYGLMLIEQPLDCDDIYEHSKLQAQLKTDICLDESIHSLADAVAAVELGSCRVINIKPGRVGGYSESKQIHDYCLENGIAVWHGGMLESGVGRAGNIALASLPGFTLPGDISASRRYYRKDIVEPEIEINPDGTVTVSNGSGIGVEVNIEQLDKVTLRKKYFSSES